MPQRGRAEAGAASGGSYSVNWDCLSFQVYFLLVLLLLGEGPLAPHRPQDLLRGAPAQLTCAGAQACFRASELGPAAATRGLPHLGLPSTLSLAGPLGPLSLLPPSVLSVAVWLFLLEPCLSPFPLAPGSLPGLEGTILSALLYCPGRHAGSV